MMCGIFAVLGASNDDRLQSGIAKSRKAIASRGPDSEGLLEVKLKDGCSSLYLAHSRLAIRDLSEAASQPMSSDCGRFHMVFNGEIYNTNMLSRLLWVSGGIPEIETSDTRILLKIIMEFGVRRALELLDSMHSILVYDSQLDEIWISIDRYGEKPLYYSSPGNCPLVFGSTYTSIEPFLTDRVDLLNEAVIEFFMAGFISAPRTIHKDVFKLESGELKKFKLTYNHSGIAVKEIASNFLPGFSDNLIQEPQTEKDFTKGVEDRFRNSLSRRFVSDVPVGVLLSGGLDSSLVALTAKELGKEFIAYTVGFAQSEFDESGNARRTAEYLNVPHRILSCPKYDALEVLNKTIDAYGEPFADSSQIPSMLLFESMKAEGVKVAIGGDGGDELFGGYRRHQLGPLTYRLRYLFKIKAVRDILTAGYSSTLFEKILRGINLQGIAQTEKLSRYMSRVSLRNPSDLYLSFLHNNEARTFISDSIAPAKLDFLSSASIRDEANVLDTFLLNDLRYYLTNDIFVKIDRASMAYGVETRTPFTDPELVAYAFSQTVRPNWKVRLGAGKLPIRSILQKHFPKNFFENSKKGFAMPMHGLLNAAACHSASAMHNFELLKCFLKPEKVEKIIHAVGDPNKWEIAWRLNIFIHWLRQRDNG